MTWGHETKKKKHHRLSTEYCMPPLVASIYWHILYNNHATKTPTDDTTPFNLTTTDRRTPTVSWTWTSRWRLMAGRWSRRMSVRWRGCWPLSVRATKVRVSGWTSWWSKPRSRWTLHFTLNPVWILWNLWIKELWILKNFKYHLKSIRLQPPLFSYSW